MPTFGVVPNPEDLDTEPLVIEFVGYRREQDEQGKVTHVPESESFKFRPVFPLQQLLDMTMSVDAEGKPKTSAVLRYLEGCVMPEDREKWRTFHGRGDLFFGDESFAELYTWLWEKYTARPTLRPSGSAVGSSAIAPTSPVASPGAASI